MINGLKTFFTASNTAAAASSDSDNLEIVGNLDLSYISKRILASGLPWALRTEKSSHRNNISDLAGFLSRTYPLNNYLIWNLSGVEYDTTPFHSQIITIPNYAPVPSLKALFDFARSLDAWLGLHRDNVAVVHCSNGIYKTGVSVACYLRYSGVFDSTREAMDYFMEMRQLGSGGGAGIGGLTGEAPWQKRYLQYFDDCITLKGQMPNPHPLRLHGIVLNGVPNFATDKEGGCEPRAEIWTAGKLTFSTSLEEEETSVLVDEFNVIFRITNPSQPSQPLTLEKDVELRISHYNAGTGSHTLIVAFLFNTGYMGTGLLRIRRSELELSNRDLDSYARLPEDFSMDLIFSNADNTGQAASNVSYASFLEGSMMKGLAKLIQYHLITPDAYLLKTLEAQGYRKVLAKLALQRSENEIHGAFEYLGGGQAESAGVDGAGGGIGEGVVEGVKDEMIRFGYQKMLNKRRDRDKLAALEKAAMKSSSSVVTDVTEVSEAVTETSPTSSDAVSTGTTTTTTVASSVKSPVEETKVEEEEDFVLQDSVIPPAPPQPGTDGIPPAPPPPPPPGQSGIPPPPPPPPGMNGGIPPPPPPPGSASLKQVPRKQVKNKLHWEEIRPTAISSLGANSIWSQFSNANSDATADLDLVKFENLFCIDPSAATSNSGTGDSRSGEGKDKTKRKVQLVDANQARMVGIVLAKFIKRMTVQQLRGFIATHDATQLDIDDLLALKGILPTDQERSEIELFLSKHGTGEALEAMDLERPDLFKIEMCKEPDVEFMLDTFLFKLQLPPDLLALRQKFETISASLRMLCDDEGIRYLLGTVLELGNLMNYEYARQNQNRGKAVGFRIATLTKLRDVKSRDGKSTLMQFLVETILSSTEDDRKGGVLEIAKRFEFGSLRHIKYDDLCATYKSACVTLTTYKNYKSKSSEKEAFEIFVTGCLKGFFKEAKDMLDQTEAVMNTAESQWKQTLEYFGEDAASSESSGGMKPEDLFMIFDVFFQGFDESVSKHLHKLEVDERNRRRRLEQLEKAEKTETPRTLPVSTISLRDQMMNEIRAASLKDLTETATRGTELETATMDTEEIAAEIEGECSECGLSFSNCDCSF